MPPALSACLEIPITLNSARAIWNLNMTSTLILVREIVSFNSSTLHYDAPIPVRSIKLFIFTQPNTTVSQLRRFYIINSIHPSALVSQQSFQDATTVSMQLIHMLECTHIPRRPCLDCKVTCRQAKQYRWVCRTSGLCIADSSSSSSSSSRRCVRS